MAGNVTRRALLGLTAASAVGAVTGASGPSGTAAGSAGRDGGGRIDWGSLGRHLDGDLILPSDVRYGQAREQAIRHFDAVNPQAVAYCESEKDVRTVIAFAQDHSVHTVPRSGGHSFGGYSTTPGMILDVSRMNRVAIDGPNVVVGAGVQQVDALAALSPHGLAMAGGLCPTVAVGGFLQGGGIGFQTRKYGMACDRLVSADVVLADGRLVRASAEENPGLFWALRGNGGGNYGVVTSYKVVPVRRSDLVSYTLTWPWAAAQSLIEHWQQWAIDAPDDLASVLLAVNPDAAAPSPQLFVTGAWYGDAEELDRRLDTLVGEVGVAPASRSVAVRSVRDAMMEMYGCATLSTEECHRVGTTPEAKSPRYNYYRTRCRMFGSVVPGSDVDDLLAVLTDPAQARTGQFRMLYFEALGGVANEYGRTDTAYVHRTTRMLAGLTTTLSDPAYTEEDTTACERVLGDAFRALDRGSLRESYQNYIDPALTDWRQAYYAENYPRLVRTKRAYDPHGFFRFARGIG